MMTTETVEKQPFINDEKYFLLKQCQKEVFEITEFSPSIRKLINDLITEENINTVKSNYIKTLKA